MLSITSNRYIVKAVEWNFTETDIDFVSIKDTGVYVVDITSPYRNDELSLVNGLLELFIEDFPQFFISVPKYEDTHEPDFPF